MNSQEDRSSVWESIRKLLDATQNNPVLTQEEVLHLGAYFTRSSKQMVTLPFALVKEYDTWLKLIIQHHANYIDENEIYTRLHAKLEEYLFPDEQALLDKA